MGGGPGVRRSGEPSHGTGPRCRGSFRGPQEKRLGNGWATPGRGEPFGPRCSASFSIARLSRVAGSQLPRRRCGPLPPTSPRSPSAGGTRVGELTGGSIGWEAPAQRQPGGPGEGQALPRSVSPPRPSQADRGRYPLESDREAAAPRQPGGPGEGSALTPQPPLPRRRERGLGGEGGPDGPRRERRTPRSMRHRPLPARAPHPRGATPLTAPALIASLREHDRC